MANKIRWHDRITFNLLIAAGVWLLAKVLPKKKETP